MEYGLLRYADAPWSASLIPGEPQGDTQLHHTPSPPSTGMWWEGCGLTDHQEAEARGELNIILCGRVFIIY